MVFFGCKGGTLQRKCDGCFWHVPHQDPWNFGNKPYKDSSNCQWLLATWILQELWEICGQFFSSSGQRFTSGPRTANWSDLLGSNRAIQGRNAGHQIVSCHVISSWHGAPKNPMYLILVWFNLGLILLVWTTQCGNATVQISICFVAPTLSSNYEVTS